VLPASTDSDVVLLRDGAASVKRAAFSRNISGGP
jgi:hypothetical protein